MALPLLSDFSPYAEKVEFWPLMHGLHPEMYEQDGRLIDGAVRATSVKLHPNWDPQGGKCKDYDIAV